MKEIRGAINEKEETKKMYELIPVQARDSGNLKYLAQQHQQNQFSARLSEKLLRTLSNLFGCGGTIFILA